MARIFVFLDEIGPNLKWFKNDQNVLDEIARAFKVDRIPQVLYDVTDDDNNRVPITTENTPLVAGKSYLWVNEAEKWEDKQIEAEKWEDKQIEAEKWEDKQIEAEKWEDKQIEAEKWEDKQIEAEKWEDKQIEAEKWEDKQMVQTALFSAMSCYQDKPLEYLQETKQFHGITRLIAANAYFENQAASIFVSDSENPTKRKGTLIIAFRGSETLDDIQTDFNFEFQSDDRFGGKIHGGFLERMKKITLESLFEIAYINKVDHILTCGHSLGGAVSTLVHFNILQTLSQDKEPFVNSENVVNMTFGAPLLGNYEFEKYLSDKNFTRNVFSFASVNDVVPIVLSVGHVFKTLQQTQQLARNVEAQIRKATTLFETCLKVAARKSDENVVDNVHREMTILKSTL